MSKATESMFDGKDVLIPLAEVSYILKFPSCIEVHFKGSAESATLVQPDQNALISAWCRYRSEVEADTLMDLDGAQPAPSVPDGFSREDLEAVADGLDGYEKTVNVGNVTGEGDDHLESTTAYAARFIRAMLAAAREAKP